MERKDYSINLKEGNDNVFFSDDLLKKLGRGFLLHIEKTHRQFRIVQISDKSDVRRISITVNSDGSMKMSEWLGKIIRELDGLEPGVGNMSIKGYWTECKDGAEVEKCFRFDLDDKGEKNHE